MFDSGVSVQDIDIVERVQCRTTKMMKGLEKLSYEKRLRGGAKGVDVGGFFPVVPSTKNRGYRHNLEHRRFPLDIRKHFCAVQVMEHWHRLPEEAVEIFKILGDLQKPPEHDHLALGVPARAGIGPNGPRGLFQP